jgi:hypothetical protein
MPGSRLPDDGSGTMPRKIAELIRSDEALHASLVRTSTLVRARGLGPRVIERILLSSPVATEGALRIAGQGLCGWSGASYSDLLHAVNSPDLHSVWRAGVFASWAEFVSLAVSRSGRDPAPHYGTSWAIAETAFWAAGKHIIEPDDAFLWALTMDAGLVALVHALPDVYAALAATPDAGAVEDFERKAFGFDHQAVGAEALRIYKFGDEACRLAATHHGPHLNLDMAGKVIRAAVVAVSQAGGDFGLGGPRLPLDRQVMDGALLRPEHQAELLTVASNALARSRSQPGSQGFRAA